MQEDRLELNPADLAQIAKMREVAGDGQYESHFNKEQQQRG